MVTAKVMPQLLREGEEIKAIKGGREDQYRCPLSPPPSKERRLTAAALFLTCKTPLAADPWLCNLHGKENTYI